MGGAPESCHGFVAGRGRGYRPGQVDAYVDALSEDRDAAWERAARLTVLAKHMAADLDALRQTLARLGPQTYASLGEGARRLHELGQEEARAVTERAREESGRQVEAARAEADRVRDAARVHADAVRAEADERVRQLLLAAQTEADTIRVGVRREVKEGRGEALAALREVRLRTDGTLTEQAREHTVRLAAAERAEMERQEAWEAERAARLAAAEESLAAAEREHAQALEQSRLLPQEARVRASDVLAGARQRADGIARETERLLREHGERWDDVRAHMDTVQDSIAALKGRAWAE
ncbi:cellulose-binding protein [Streptomyces tropicalis]|uniref:Cellulose-binding protein n=1 Tax=Streptomyces tropicalis TaxID=3034234 RepID=A0ABT6AAG0_9ACTN|nr:cellulose-binding protein [Streptomyces tropicalis]MDF3301643.1 cellulose-binding protein [Streptomyces tropicalis]